MSIEPNSRRPDAGDRAAVVLLRRHVKRRFPPGVLELRDQVGYYAVVHAAWRISQTHAIYDELHLTVEECAQKGEKIRCRFVQHATSEETGPYAARH